MSRTFTYSCDKIVEISLFLLVASEREPENYKWIIGLILFPCVASVDHSSVRAMQINSRCRLTQSDLDLPSFFFFFKLDACFCHSIGTVLL